MRTINTVVIHHSVTSRDLPLQKSINSFSQNHKDRLNQPISNETWLYVAYHYVIAWDGSRQKTRWLDEIWYHASDWDVNKESIWICFTWNFDEEHPSESQIKTWSRLLSEIFKKYPNVKVIWHRDVPWVTKTCPWKNFYITSLYKEQKEEKLKILYNALIDAIPLMSQQMYAIDLEKQLRENWYNN